MDVIGIGNPVMDFLIQTKRIPHLNNVGPFEKSSWQGGGKVPTAMVTLGRLGANVGIIGKVADDVYGQFCRNDLIRHNVDVSRLKIQKKSKNTFCLCLAETETRTRTFIYNQGTIENIKKEDLDYKYISKSKMIHLADMDKLNLEAAKYAKSNRIKVIIDVDNNTEFLDRNMEYIDVFIASEYYYNNKYGNLDYKSNCKSISNKGPEIVVFTLGEKGCVAYAYGQYYEIPAFTNLNIVDTTGAGDVFHGAFIFGLLRKWKIEDILIFASAAAAINCTKLGGRAGIPKEKTVKRFIQTGDYYEKEVETRVKLYENGLENYV